MYLCPAVLISFQISNWFFCLCEIYMSLATVYDIHAPSLRRMLVTTASPSDFHLTLPFVLGSLCIYVGAYLRIISFRALGRQFTIELSLKQDHKLITHGPYALVRHPAYLGAVIMTIGEVVTQVLSPGTWWVESGMWYTWQGKIAGVYWVVFATAICFILSARVAMEDAVLKREFRQEWEKWSQRTPYAIIPFVW